MNGSADQDPGTGVSDRGEEAGLEQNPTEHSKGPPKEGSNRGNGPEEQKRANISDTVTTGAAADTDLTDLTPAEGAVQGDGELGVEDVALEDDDEAARKELDDIHEHADPSKGDKEAGGGDRVKTDGGSHGAADEQATKARRSI